MSRYDPQGTIMDEMDFDRRRELRRQKREEMRLEAERLTRNDDDDEEAARERRRRARQERMRARELEESSGQPDSLVETNCHSMTESVSASGSFGGGSGEEEDQALLERVARREERRQRRLMEALERQRQPDETEGQDSGEKSQMVREEEEAEQRSSSWRQAKMHSYMREEEPVARAEEEKIVMEEKPRRSYLREEESTDESIQAWEGSHSVVSTNQAEDFEAPEGAFIDIRTHVIPRYDNQADNELCERGQSREEQRKQNGGLHDDEEEEEEEEQEEQENEEEEEEATAKQYREPERTFGSRGGAPYPDDDDEQGDQDASAAARLEAELKLEELKRRREDTESEEFERMRQKQQESEAQLEDLKRKREERRKVLEEEERQRKQDEAERKAREEEEKRKMKEEIERRRAEAAEKRQKVEDPVDDEEKLFKCVSPRGSSLKIGERAEFLNKSAQKSTVKTSLSPVVSKIDNRLEQYTSAAQESRSPRSGTVDLPTVTDSIRNIKSMWEKGSVFNSPGSTGSTFKEASLINPGVAGRINDWLNKAPESGKTSGARPSDLKPVDVTNKRSLWENKGSSAAKAPGRGETKSVTNGMGY
ncbi:caldesmon 1a isoform X3 [Syngnathus acus]|uniref:caldesmon 1a isoform X3 n=1 Tax=Syngnathus acus TaxID=161584 RepID=UPI0018862F09|nr:caldesmon 1a isoform X3 [Syngnathus acus]